MTQSPPSDARVADARQAALLLDVSLRPLIGLLMKAPHSASELARSLDLSVQRTHYLIGKLTAAGVADVDSLQPRAGRAMKRYRVAARWFIPFEVTGAETLHAFLAAQIMPRMEAFLALSLQQIGDTYSHWGYWMQHDGGSGSLNLGDPAGTARALFEGDEPFLLNIGTAHLTRLQASVFKRRLIELLAEFDLPPQEDAAPYSVGLLLVRGEIG